MWSHIVFTPAPATLQRETRVFLAEKMFGAGSARAYRSRKPSWEGHDRHCQNTFGKRSIRWTQQEVFRHPAWAWCRGYGEHSCWRNLLEYAFKDGCKSREGQNVSVRRHLKNHKTANETWSLERKGEEQGGQSQTCCIGKAWPGSICWKACKCQAAEAHELA